MAVIFMECTVCDFYRWGNFKQKFYIINPSSLQASEVEIWNSPLQIMEGKFNDVGGWDTYIGTKSAWVVTCFSKIIHME